ncbi:hypothetical protein KY389_06485 [Paracoccus bogoriensis]|nr:hypothetical protein [Paracoccus bogoriensis]
MRAGAGFHTEQAGRRAVEELQHLAVPRLATQDSQAFGIDAVQLKNRFRQIDPE